VSTSVRFLVDGFNVYHAIREVERRQGHDCHWLDIRGLCASALQLIGPQAHLGEVHYFSALAHHLERSKPGTVGRHQQYLEALRATGVVIHLGAFKPKDIRYRSETCRVQLRRHEEKETDVAIAAMVIESALADECPAVCVVSGDTDLVPAFRTVQRVRPSTRLYSLFPPYRANRAFRPHVDGDFKVAPTRLRDTLLPDPVVDSEGRPITKPTAW